MKLAVFNSKPYTQFYFEEANRKFHFDIDFLKWTLNARLAHLAHDCDAICIFVNDECGRETLEILSRGKTKIIALRCAGFNNVDVVAAKQMGFRLVRVPAYSPHAVAEHAVALILALNRKIYRAVNRVKDGNFELDGLLGFELFGKTIGIIGTGKIGETFAGIMQGFGCKLLGYDLFPNERCEAIGVQYVSLAELLSQSDIVSIHCPLSKETHHIINQTTIRQMKNGVMLVNTSRGGLIDTEAAIEGLKAGKIGYMGLDVYEEEDKLFFEDRSSELIMDDVFARLLTFPNVIITGHQAFFTDNALQKIATITLQNIQDISLHGRCDNELGGHPTQSDYRRVE